MQISTYAVRIFFIVSASSAQTYQTEYIAIKTNTISIFVPFVTQPAILIEIH